MSNDKSTFLNFIEIGTIRFDKKSFITAVVYVLMMVLLVAAGGSAWFFLMTIWFLYNSFRIQQKSEKYYSDLYSSAWLEHQLTIERNLRAGKRSGRKRT